MAYKVALKTETSSAFASLPIDRNPSVVNLLLSAEIDCGFRSPNTLSSDPFGFSQPIEIQAFENDSYPLLNCILFFSNADFSCFLVRIFDLLISQEEIEMGVHRFLGFLWFYLLCGVNPKKPMQFLLI